MSLTPLSSGQQQALDKLRRERRLEAVPPDLGRAGAFLEHAQLVFDDLPHLTRTRNRYILAYDAAHDVGEALLAAYGFRTRGGPGQHEAVGRFLEVVLDGPNVSDAARRFDRLRRGRNRAHYEAAPVGNADANLAEATARSLYAAARARGIPA